MILLDSQISFSLKQRGISFVELDDSQVLKMIREHLDILAVYDSNGELLLHNALMVPLTGIHKNKLMTVSLSYLFIFSLQTIVLEN